MDIAGESPYNIITITKDNYNLGRFDYAMDVMADGPELYYMNISFEVRSDSLRVLFFP